MNFPFPANLDIDPRRQSIGHRDAYAMQAAGESIGAIARSLVELSPGMEPGEGQNYNRDLFFGMQADRYAAAVVGHRCRAVQMQGYVDVTGESGERFIGGIIYGLGQNMGGRTGVGIHPGPLPDRFQSLEYAEGCFIVGLFGHDRKSE